MPSVFEIQCVLIIDLVQRYYLALNGSWVVSKLRVSCNVHCRIICY